MWAWVGCGDTRLRGGLAPSGAPPASPWTARPLGSEVPAGPLSARLLVPSERGADPACGRTGLSERSGVRAPSCRGSRPCSAGGLGLAPSPGEGSQPPASGSVPAGAFLTNVLHLGDGVASIPSSLGRFLSQEQKCPLRNVLLRLLRAPGSRRAPSVRPAGLFLARTQRVPPSPAPCVSLCCCLGRVSGSVSSGGRLAPQGLVRVSPPFPHEQPGGLLLSPQFLGGFVGDVPRAPKPQ